jgi:hypothetical protein
MPRGDALSRSRRVQLIDIVEREFVTLPRDSVLQRYLAGQAARLGVIMKVRARVHGFDAVCRMVETGVGIAIVPEASAKRSKRSMRIDAVRLQDSGANRRLAICVRNLHSLPVGARQLVEHLRRVGTNWGVNAIGLAANLSFMVERCLRPSWVNTHRRGHPPGASGFPWQLTNLCSAERSNSARRRHCLFGPMKVVV